MVRPHYDEFGNRINRAKHPALHHQIRADCRRLRFSVAIMRFSILPAALHTQILAVVNHG
jgi:hypothetical protein